MGTRKTALKARTKQAALMAQLGRESRLNPDHFQASAFGFVLNKTLKLEKAPVAYPVVHTLSAIDFPYSFEVFQYYSTTIKAGDDALAYVVINPSHEPLLPSTQLPKKPLGRTSAFSLKNRTQMLKLSLDLFDFGRVVKPAIARNGEVVNSEVDAKNTLLRSIVNSIDFFRETEKEETPSFFVNSEQALSQFPTIEVFHTASRYVDVELLPTTQRNYAQNISCKPSRARKIITNTGFSDNRLAFSFFDNATSLLDASNSKLRGKFVGFSKLPVDNRVELNIIPNPVLPCNVYAELQSFTVSLNSSGHFIGSGNFDLGNSATNHTQQQKNITINTLAGQMSSVQ